MLDLQEMKSISKTENVIFYKLNCPFCKAAEELMKELAGLEIIKDYKIYILDKDFDNQTLTDLVIDSGWKPEGIQNFCAKPQIFIQSEYIGGNFEFYKSKWNLGQNQSGMINGKNSPNRTNPMRF